MNNVYLPGDSTVTLRTDLAAEYLLYMYVNKNKDFVLWSRSLPELLDDPRVIKPLALSDSGISFLLQSGVVPPPQTVYEDVYVLGIGDSATVSTQNGNVKVDFCNEFPFLNTERLKAEEMMPNEADILQLLAEATLSRLEGGRQNILFHSAGKDSNALALSLAEAGWQDRVTLVCHKSQGAADESEISRGIAERLGFKHKTLEGIERFEERDATAINDYFRNVAMPSTDGVTVAYPLYMRQMPELAGSNLIDGMGNDVYIGHVPSSSEYRKQKYFSWPVHPALFTGWMKSTGLIHAGTKSRAEWTGLTGFSFSDAKALYPGAMNARKYWFQKSQAIAHLDYFDFRALIRGAIIDPHVFMRKVRNFADFSGANVVFPWANERVANYFSKLPEVYLFDRVKFKNKLILRDMLKSRIGLDSDSLGKKGFSFGYRHLMVNSRVLVEEEIFSCDYWDPRGVRDVMRTLIREIQRPGRTASVAGMLLHRLYVLSAWLNHSKYVQ